MTPIVVIKDTDNQYKFALSYIDGITGATISIDCTSITAGELHNNQGQLIASSVTTPTSWDFTNVAYIGISIGTSIFSSIQGNQFCYLIVTIGGKKIKWDTQLFLSILN